MVISFLDRKSTRTAPCAIGIPEVGGASIAGVEIAIRAIQYYASRLFPSLTAAAINYVETLKGGCTAPNVEEAQHCVRCFVLSARLN
jgi:hypothetical protein